MKKLLFLFLVLCSVQSYGQTRLTPMETKDLFVKTNNMFTEFYTDIIDCMFVFDQTKYDQAIENLKLVILNYDIIDKMGTFTGSGAMSSSARQSFIASKYNSKNWQIQLQVNYDKFKNDKRNKTVKYRYDKKKIPSSLSKLFKQLVDESNEVGISNML